MWWEPRESCSTTAPAEPLKHQAPQLPPVGTTLIGWEKEDVLGETARWPNSQTTSAYMVLIPVWAINLRIGLAPSVSLPSQILWFCNFWLLLESYHYHANGFAWSSVTNSSSTSRHCLSVTFSDFLSKHQQLIWSGLNMAQPCQPMEDWKLPRNTLRKEQRVIQM